MSETKGNIVSKIRGMVKGGKADAFLTDRYIYALVLSFARVFIKRKDDSYKISRNSSLFQKLPGVPLIEVSKIEAGCIDIELCCTFRRTENKLPPIFEGMNGPIIRTVTSIDGSKNVNMVLPKVYTNLTKSIYYKYNKELYCWFIDGYLYFPNVTWPVVDIDAMWENDITSERCDAENCCITRQDEKCFIPDDILADIEEPVRQKLMGLVQIPKDTLVDNQSNLR